ncbi:MAG: hypothetical protein C6W57_14030 [Caldibacillus debilis]|nr:MAG: hypothetical protein C6W57_14030 [Caldibacillus debilis]REJ28755.1 MAG: hypothetical protein C6W56_07405 [Caldibacillus debilis]
MPSSVVKIVISHIHHLSPGFRRSGRPGGALTFPFAGRRLGGIDGKAGTFRMRGSFATHGKKRRFSGNPIERKEKG